MNAADDKLRAAVKEAEQVRRAAMDSNPDDAKVMARDAAEKLIRVLMDTDDGPKALVNRFIEVVGINEALSRGQNLADLIMGQVLPHVLQFIRDNGRVPDEEIDGIDSFIWGSWLLMHAVGSTCSHAYSMDEWTEKLHETGNGNLEDFVNDMLSVLYQVAEEQRGGGDDG